MATLWEKQQQRKLAKAQGKGPVSKPPSAPPSAGQVEPLMPAIPAASAVPAFAPVAEPEPASSPAPVSKPAPVSAPAPALMAPPPLKAAKPLPPPVLQSPAPAAAPAQPVAAPPQPEPVAASPEPGMTGSGSFMVGSGDIEVERDETGPSPPPSVPPVSAQPSLADLLPEEAPAGLASLPVEEAPQAASVAHVPELRRKESNKLAFKQLADNGFLPSRYKLTYLGQEGATACKFALIGKETHEVTLELGEPKSLEVQTKGGPMKVTLTYTGVSKSDGAKEVEYTVEGGISAVTGVLERFRNVGPVALSAFRSFVKHLPEAIAVGFAAGLAVCGFTLDWVGAQLGRFHPYVTVAVPVLMTALAAWTWAERSKDIKRESEKSE